MDNITAMRTVEVRPDQRELTSAKDTKDDNKKDTYTRLIEGMPILIVVACVALVWAVIIMSTKADTENTLKDIMSGLSYGERLTLTICFLFWVVTMGCIGSI